MVPIDTDLVGYGLSFSLLIFGVFLIVNPEAFLRKDLDEDMRRIGKILFPVVGSMLLLMGSGTIGCIYFDWWGFLI